MVVLIIFLVILQTFIIVMMLSIGGQEAKLHTHYISYNTTH